MWQQEWTQRNDWINNHSTTIPNTINVIFIYQLKKLTIKAWCAYNAGFGYNDLAPSEQNKSYLYAVNTNGDPYLPSWYTLNLSSNYQFTSKFNFNLSIENVTNQRYRTYSSGISAPGFNVITALIYNF